jgi:DNA repair photolyase
MSTQLEFGGAARSQLATSKRQVMNGKPVFSVPAKTVINFESAFEHKLLCDGPTFSTGSACAYSCSFCYVPDLMRKLRAIPAYDQVKGAHDEIVIRRDRAVEVLRSQLTDRYGRPKFKHGRTYHSGSNRKLRMAKVIYASPLVDVAANMELVRETIEACRAILELTDWDIRLLSKSNLLPRIAQGLEVLAPVGQWTGPDGWRDRVIYGVSTGTLDDGLAKCIEGGAALVSKRLESLHWLQDEGYRTFGMVCPSLPQADYSMFARSMAGAIRADRCEHVWAEVMNVRGESLTRTIEALKTGGFYGQSDLLQAVMEYKPLWESYARQTFQAHAGVLPPGKLRFLQYVKGLQLGSAEWWAAQKDKGAVVL